MPKVARHPDLQGKFENLLSKLPNRVFGGDDIKKQLNTKAVKDTFTKDEMEFLIANLGNALNKAKQSGIIKGLGKRRGYEKISSDDAVADTDFAEAERNSWESFLHFPATFLLAEKFDDAGRARSRPSRGGAVAWGNPDMLYLRPNLRLGAVKDEGDAAALLRKFDVSPQLLISSIEIKFDLNSRRTQIEALSEAAFNGRWANETWLLVFDLFTSDGRGKVDLDADAIRFANDNGIGILRASIVTADNEHAFEVETFLPARLRVQIEAGPDLLNNLIDDMRKIDQAFDKDGGYDDQDTEDHSLALKLVDAYENLKMQTGFKNDVENGMKKIHARSPANLKNALHGLLDGKTFEQLKSRLGTGYEKLETVDAAFKVLPAPKK